MITEEAKEQKKEAIYKESGEAVISLPFDPARNLAMVLQSLEDEELRFAELRTEHKDAMEKLRKLASKLRREILTGQNTLPLDAA